MKKIDIERLPEAVKNQVIPKSEAAKIIWEEIYVNPRQYGLIFFNEDQKSDLLLAIHEQFEKIFDKFVPGTVSFKTFIAGCLSNYKNSFLRNQIKKEREKHTVDSFLAAKTEEDCKKYSPETEDFCDSEKPCESMKFSHFMRKTKRNSKEGNKRIASLTLLLLALKACKDIDDETVLLLSSFTGIDKTLLYKKIEELKKSMEKKELYKTKLERRRDNAFFFHRKYMNELLVDSSEENSDELRKKYEMQTSRWKNHNQNLALRSNSPSNEEIAKAIGLKTRTVSFYINHVKNLKIQKKIKRIYDYEKSNGLKYEDGLSYEFSND